MTAKHGLTILLATLLLATVALAVPGAEPSRVESETSYAPNGPCQVAGKWVVNAPPFLPELGDQTLIAYVTITPLDPTCRRFSYSLVPVNPELSFAGIFPEAITPPGLVGSMVRIGGIYELSAIAHSPGAPPAGLPIRGRVLYFWTYDGAVACNDAACNRLVQEGTASLFSNIDDPDRSVPEVGIFGVEDQDLDDDGFADEGELPILAAPFPLSGRRVGPQP